MELIVGLGNPGEKYKNTRHNVGFAALDHLASTQFSVNNDQFKAKKKLRSLVAEINLEGKKIILAKPQTFMNNSGDAVQSLLKSYKLQASRLLVLHDEIDLPFGEIRLSKNASAAGHKGVQNIIDNLGTQDFIRVRVGIESRTDGSRPDTESFVLQKFTKEEIEKLNAQIFLESNKKIEEFLQN